MGKDSIGRTLAVLVLAFGGWLAIYAALVGAMLAMDSVVVRLLWAWLVVPVFGLSPLGYAASAGLAIVVGYLAANTPPVWKHHEMDSFKSLAAILLRNLTFLACGWALHFFIGGAP